VQGVSRIRSVLVSQLLWHRTFPLSEMHNAHSNLCFATASLLLLVLSVFDMEAIDHIKTRLARARAAIISRNPLSSSIKVLLLLQ
jgi:hypothetical protein